MKKALVKLKPNKYSESTFMDSYDSMKEKYSELSSTELAKQLKKFISEKQGQHRIVVVVDEVGQFVRGDKSGDRLLELQGIAESFKNVGNGKLWLLVTAQEKLTTVLKEVDIKQSDVSKISDRFKTTIHLESEDVQRILDERIFKKTDEGRSNLKSLYDDYAGNISDLASPESTKDLADAKNLDNFVKNYPLLPYHRSELPRVLFSTRSKGTTGGTERGMIEVTHQLIRDNLAEDELGRIPTIPEIYVSCGDAVGGDTIQSHRLRKANEDFPHHGGIEPKEIMQTILFLQDIPAIERNLDNITRGLISDLKVPISEKREAVKQHLDDLVNGKELIRGKGYSIAGAADRKLLKEKDNFYPTTAEINKRLKNQVKELDFYDEFKKVQLEKHNTYTINRVYGESGNFGGGQISLILVEPDFESEEKRKEKVKSIAKKSSRDRKNQTVYLIPDYVPDLTGMVDELLQREKVADEYRGSSDPEMKSALDDWTSQIDNTYKPKLNRELRNAFYEGTLIEKGNKDKLEKDGFMNQLKEALDNRAKDLYSERLQVTSPDKTQIRKLLQAPPEKRSTLPVGNQFQFFGSDGNFQEGGKVTSEISDQCKGETTGKELENNFAGPPYGWGLDAVKYGVAALFVADQIMIKSEGRTLHSGQAKEAIDLFQKIQKFRDAKFFTPEGTKLTAQEKEEAIGNLEELPFKPDEVSSHLNAHQLAEKINDYVNTQKEKTKRIASTFSSHGIETSKLKELSKELKALHDIYKKETPARTVKEFIESEKVISELLDYLVDAESFRSNHLEEFSEQYKFVNTVKEEMEKNPDLFSDEKADIQLKVQEFGNTFTGDPVKNQKTLADCQSEVWDKYHEIIKPQHELRSEKYRRLVEKVEKAKREVDDESIANSEELITEFDKKVTQLEKKICDQLKLSSSTGKCQNCHSGLSEINSNIEAVEAKREEIDKIKKKAKPVNPVKEKTVNFHLKASMSSDDFIKKMEEIREEIREKKLEAKRVNVQIHLED